MGGADQKRTVDMGGSGEILELEETVVANIFSSEQIRNPRQKWI